MEEATIRSLVVDGLLQVFFPDGLALLVSLIHGRLELLEVLPARGALGLARRGPAVHALVARLLRGVDHLLGLLEGRLPAVLELLEAVPELLLPLQLLLGERLLNLVHLVAELAPPLLKLLQGLVVALLEALFHHLILLDRLVHAAQLLLQQRLLVLRLAIRDLGGPAMDALRLVGQIAPSAFHKLGHPVHVRAEPARNAVSPLLLRLRAGLEPLQHLGLLRRALLRLLLEKRLLLCRLLLETALDSVSVPHSNVLGLLLLDLPLRVLLQLRAQPAAHSIHLRLLAVEPVLHVHRVSRPGREQALHLSLFEGLGDLLQLFEQVLPLLLPHLVPASQALRVDPRGLASSRRGLVQARLLGLRHYVRLCDARDLHRR
mmetsp:Transcript_61098/g.157552  ORF Transcript_61098/g.157552 Transcript_61098/m.157552 type:complete len:375 (+) Transcript_61098:359-1483(+)